MITDSFGRAWRLGQLDVAIGVAGLRRSTTGAAARTAAGASCTRRVIALADAVAAAADLARAKNSGEPVVIVRGLAAHVSRRRRAGRAALLRAAAEDLFR